MAMFALNKPVRTVGTGERNDVLRFFFSFVFGISMVKCQNKITAEKEFEMRRER